MPAPAAAGLIPAGGVCGKRGTSCMAMMFPSSWLKGFGQAVRFRRDGGVRETLRRGGAL